MKRKFNYLKSAVPALALSLILLGSITSPSPEPEDPNSFPTRQPVIEENVPDREDNEGEGVQPLSDLDEITKTFSN